MTSKKYVFKACSDSFPHLFEKEKLRILSALNQDVLIEHIGSTAVPGLGGKGIIDIAIACSKEEMPQVSLELQAIGYEYRSQFSTHDRFYFLTYLEDSEEGLRRYHIHLTFPQNKEWSDFLAFRDYLKRNPDSLKEYAELKMKASLASGDNGVIYRTIKEPFFKKTLDWNDAK